MSSFAIIKQKIHILNTLIKLGTTYAYYAISFSKPNIKKIRQDPQWIK